MYAEHLRLLIINFNPVYDEKWQFDCLYIFFDRLRVHKNHWPISMHCTRCMFSFTDLRTLRILLFIRRRLINNANKTKVKKTTRKRRRRKNNNQGKNIYIMKFLFLKIAPCNAENERSCACKKAT